MKTGDRVLYYRSKRGYATKKFPALVIKVYEKSNRVRILLPDGKSTVTIPECLEVISNE